MATARSGLHDYLTASNEKTDASTLKLLRGVDQWRLLSMVAAFGGKKGAEAYYAEQDLLALHRVLVAVLGKVPEIDSWLLLYRFEYGQVADKLEEVQNPLLQARKRYLDLVDDAFPTFPERSPRIDQLQKAADTFFADSRGRAADKKLEQVKESLKVLQPQVKTLNRLRPGNPGSNTVRNYNPLTAPPNEADTLEFEVNELARDLGRTKAGARDERVPQVRKQGPAPDLRPASEVATADVLADGVAAGARSEGRPCRRLR